VIRSGTRRQKLALLSLGAFAAGAVMVPAATAWANPPGCDNWIAGGATSGGYLTARATGTCGTSETRDMRAEIKQDLNARPDGLVAAADQYATTKNYDKSVSSCDHGNRGYYYGRGFFTSNATYRDTAHTYHQTCG